MRPCAARCAYNPIQTHLYVRNTHTRSLATMAKQRDKSGVHDEGQLFTLSFSLSHLWGFKFKIETLSVLTALSRNLLLLFMGLRGSDNVRESQNHTICVRCKEGCPITGIVLWPRSRFLTASKREQSLDELEVHSASCMMHFLLLLWKSAAICGLLSINTISTLA